MINKLLGKKADLCEHWNDSRGGSERGFCGVDGYRIIC